MKTQKLIQKLSVFLVILMTFSLMGCSQPKPEESVNKFFENLKKGDFKTASNYIGNDKNGTSLFSDNKEEALTKQIFSKVSCEVVSSSVQGDNAVVKTKVTSPDLVKITGNMITELLPKIMSMAFSGGTKEDSEKMVNDYYAKSLSDPNAPKTTSEVNINLVMDKEKKIWIIKGDDALLNALTGNLSKAVNELNNSAKGQ